MSRWIFAALTLMAALVPAWWMMREYSPAPAWAAGAEATIAAEFEDGTPSEQAYEDLVRYLVSGFMQHRTAEESMARYPGLPSSNGERSDQLEGFARIAPLMASWVRGGRGRTITLDDGSQADLVNVVAAGIAAGTDPTSPGYWGTPRGFDQRIVEAADIARALWLLSDEIWSSYPDKVKRQVIAWLSATESAPAYDNNWLLMQETVAEVIAVLEGTPRQPSSRKARIASFRSADGWFKDGSAGEVDYYNAWSFQYEFFWQRQINPGAWPERDGDARFVQQLLHLITPAGYPVFGRSICYRGAVTVPIVAAALEQRYGVTASLARRAMDATWSYFIEHGMLANGVITQGYCGRDPRVIDAYSGPASCLWSTRSLVLAFLVPRHEGLWAGAGNARLPIEEGDFTLPAPGLSATIVGDAKTGNVRILTNNGNGTVEPVSQRLRHWVKGAIREAQIALSLPVTIRLPVSGAYDRKEYSSQNPFCGCAR